MGTRRALGAVAGAAAAGTTSRMINRAGIRRRIWPRTNYTGQPLTLFEGPAAATGAAAGLITEAVVAGSLGDQAAGRRAVASLVAVGGSAAVGAYDDLAGSTQAKGFRGHLGALRQGKVTSGMIKIAGIGTAALAAAVIDRPTGSRPKVLTEVMINTGLIAGTANLTNLLDLRPGRAAKMIIGVGLLTPGSAPVSGAALGVLADDLAGRSMLGDAGANALGAGLGSALTRLPLPLRVAVLAGVVGLNLASEKVSFTAVIENNDLLRTLDELGRELPRGGAPDGPGEHEPEPPDER